jgi:hypothetical protein
MPVTPKSYEKKSFWGTREDEEGNRVPKGVVVDNYN